MPTRTPIFRPNRDLLPQAVGANDLAVYRFNSGRATLVRGSTAPTIAGGVNPDTLDGVSGLRCNGTSGSVDLFNCGDGDHVLFWFWGFTQNSSDFCRMGRGQDGSGNGWSLNLSLNSGPAGASGSAITISTGATQWNTSAVSGAPYTQPRRWYFVAGGFSHGNGIRVWVDGRLTQSVNFAPTANTWRSSTVGTRLGIDNSAGTFSPGAFACAGVSFLTSGGGDWAANEAQVNDIYRRTREPMPTTRWFVGVSIPQEQRTVGAIAELPLATLPGGGGGSGYTPNTATVCYLRV